MKLKTTSFEEAWAVMEALGYQYGEDALEQVRFGWELAQVRGPTKSLPEYVTEGIDFADMTPEDLDIVEDFYKDACHAEWCEYDEMMLRFVATRSRLNGQHGAVIAGERREHAMGMKYERMRKAAQKVLDYEWGESEAFQGNPPTSQSEWCELKAALEALR